MRSFLAFFWYARMGVSPDTTSADPQLARVAENGGFRDRSDNAPKM